MHIFSNHQRKQVELIEELERNSQRGSNTASVVSPVCDFLNDTRMCLTAVQLLSKDFIEKIENEIISPLKIIDPTLFYYDKNSLHTTIKNIRVISDPPNFDEGVINKAKEVFAKVIPNHKKFNIYFYKLVLFQNSLSLLGTTDPEFDNLLFDLDKNLNSAYIPDDKKYLNTKYFFSNVTLARFGQEISDEFRQKAEKISDCLNFDPYRVNNVSLLSANVVMAKRKTIGIWELNN